MEPSENVFALLAKAQKEIAPVGKTEKNTQQGYSYRGAEAVTNAVHAVFAKHGLIVTSEVLDRRLDERVSKKDTVLFVTDMRVRWTIHAPDGSSVTTETVGYGMDTSDKGANKAYTVAYREALCKLLSLPTADDSEVDSHEVKAYDFLGQLTKELTAAPDKFAVEKIAHRWERAAAAGKFSQDIADKGGLLIDEAHAARSAA